MSPEDQDSGTQAADRPGVVDAGPLGELPLLSARQVRIRERLARGEADGRIRSLLGWPIDASGDGPDVAPPEVLWLASGLRRPGVVAQMSWPRLATRLGLGIEAPIAHALVDRLLGYDRPAEEGRLQVTPVEWGILTFLIAETLARLDEEGGPLGPWDFTLDRVGPDPFDLGGLGPVVTLRWPVRLGSVAGSVRLWIPEALIALWLVSDPPPPPALSEADAIRGRFGDLAGVWRAEAGEVTLSGGLGRLRGGIVVPIDPARLGGSPQSPSGPIELASRDRAGRSWFPAEAMPGTGGRYLTLTDPLRRQSMPREAIAVSAPQDPAQAPSASPDLPVTLVVELGRVNLPLHRVADLKPGDVLELGRHAREPVELTSGGRLIARGELVQIDTELGMRILSVFL